MTTHNNRTTPRFGAVAAGACVSLLLAGMGQAQGTQSYPSSSPYQNQPYQNQTYQNQTYPSQTTQNQPYQNQPYSTQSQPYPGTSTYPGQTSQAQPYPGTSTYPGQISQAQQYGSYQTGTQAQISRASNFLGTDVISSDGRRVGDVSDFVLDVGQQPRLAFIIVKSGGFLGLGEDVRAIPADAVTISGPTARLNVTRDQFTQVAKIEGDRKQFLSNPQNVSRLNQQLQSTSQAQWRQSGRQQLVEYSELNRRDVYSSQGGQLGQVQDVWISGSRDRAPYIEIQPAGTSFGASSERVAIPMSRLQSGQNDNRLTFSITPDEIRSAPVVSDAQGLDLGTMGSAGDRVLRVSTVAQSGSSAAGSATGFSSADPQQKAREAAQRVQSAFQRDPSLRNAGVQAIAVEEKVRLNGTVSTDQLRDRLLQVAEGVVSGVTIDNQIQVPDSSGGYASADPEQKARDAAQKIQSALDNDPSLRQANVQVNPDEAKVRLDGTVSTDQLRDRIVEAAQNAASGVTLDNQLQVPDSSAGSPTGFSSAQMQQSTQQARDAAQKIRQAFQDDPSLRQASVQVIPVEEKVRLNGTVDTDQLRDRLVEVAEGAAAGVTIDNQLQIPNQ